MEMQKQEQLMKMVEVLESIRPDGKRRVKELMKQNKTEQEGENRKHKIHPSAKKLLCVLLREESMNQRNIASRMNLTAQAVSEILKKLEGRGFIRKEGGEINNENIVILTQTGEEIARKLEREMHEYAEQIFAGFTEEELKELETLLDKLYLNRIKMKNND
ncbi:MAG: MarR family transcriptional regulator [Lachnospiraceae bacterium]